MSARHINWFLLCVTILRESGSIYIFGEYSFKKKAGSQAAEPLRTWMKKKAQKIFESGFQSKFMLCCNFFYIPRSFSQNTKYACVLYQNRNTKMHKCRLCDTKLSKLESQKCVNWFLFLFLIFFFFFFLWNEKKEILEWFRRELIVSDLMV